MKPRIAITVGDPAGIGPEIAEKAASDPRVRDACAPVIYAPAAGCTFAPGVASAESGRAAYDAICRAVEDAKGGRVDAIATAPVNKLAFSMSGLPWKGHTDLLGHLTGSTRAVMMFWSETLKVVLATVHIPLANVPRALTPELLDDVIDLGAGVMPKFGTPLPSIVLAGLNPHAGEEGLMGDEERTILAPAVMRARERGLKVHGPFPGDTVFGRAVRGEFDLVVAMYHDQGLIPVKLIAFGRAVNVTLGLPIIRTSVDHGTAFDIAGKGIADPSSMVEAVVLAARMAAANAS